MRIVHRTIGILFVVIFLATGFYMRTHFPGAYQDDPGMRMMFRSAHVYILFSALLNLLAGAHLRQRHTPWRRALQILGSWLLVVAPFMFTVAFFIEPAPQKFDRPIVVCALILALSGTVLHTMVSYETECI